MAERDKIIAIELQIFFTCWVERRKQQTTNTEKQLRKASIHATHTQPTANTYV